MQERIAVAFDLGGTNIKAGLLTSKGRLLAGHLERTEGARGPDTVIERLASLVKKLATQAGVSHRSLVGCGIGLPGPLDAKRTKLFSAINLPGWKNVPLASRLERKLKIPCFMENDANLAAVGEAWQGAGRRANSFCLYTLGTGIGGGVIIDRELWSGASGAAGELGHMTLEMNGRLCGCGQKGCLEAYASATAMVRRCKERLKQGARSPLESETGMTAKKIFDAAKGGDALAREIVSEVTLYLGAAIANVVHALHPDLILLSGGMAQAGAILFEPIRREVRRRVFPVFVKKLRILPAKFGDDAGVYGAAAWAFRNIQS